MLDFQERTETLKNGWKVDNLSFRMASFQLALRMCCMPSTCRRMMNVLANWKQWRNGNTFAFDILCVSGMKWEWDPTHTCIDTYYISYMSILFIYICLYVIFVILYFLYTYFKHDTRFNSCGFPHFNWKLIPTGWSHQKALEVSRKCRSTSSGWGLENGSPQKVLRFRFFWRLMKYDSIHLDQSVRWCFFS